MSNSFSAGLFFGRNPITAASGAQHGAGHLAVSALAHWERRLAGFGGCCPLSQLPHSLQHSMPESQREFHPGAVIAEISSCLLWFPQSPTKYSSTEVAGGPHYHPCLFPLPCLPPEEGKSSAAAFTKNLLLNPLFSQEQLFHQLPTTHLHGQPKAFPFYRAIISSWCWWEWGQAWSAAAK